MECWTILYRNNCNSTRQMRYIWHHIFTSRLQLKSMAIHKHTIGSECYNNSKWSLIVSSKETSLTWKEINSSKFFMNTWRHRIWAMVKVIYTWHQFWDSILLLLCWLIWTENLLEQAPTVQQLLHTIFQFWRIIYLNHILLNW